MSSHNVIGRHPDGIPETAVAGRPPVSADAIGQHRRTHDAGVGLQAARRAAASARGCAEHPDRADRRCRPRPARRRSAAKSTRRRWTASSRKESPTTASTPRRCARPTRASLLTGRNHHRVGNGQIAELANDWDGYSGHHPEEQRDWPPRCFKHYGYTTGAWGKWHNTPAEETTAAGPFDYWPTGYGFEYFYGFLAGEASQYEPNLVRNTTSVAPPRTPEEGYHLSEDLADDAIGWLRRHKALQPDKPFYMYWASGAIHGPHHIMKEWADKYKGKFDDGWDAYRERVFAARQGKGLDSAGRSAHAAPSDHAVLGQHSGGRETLPAPTDGSRGGLRRARGCTGRPARRRDRSARLRREHADLLHLGRQRVLGRGPERHDQRVAGPERHPHDGRAAHQGARDLGGLDVLGSPKIDNQYHAGWALGRQHAVQRDEAPRLALRRDAQPDGGPVAGEDQAGRDTAAAIPSRATMSCRRSTRSSASPRRGR